VDQDVIDLYDQFTHSDMPRREFLSRLAKLAGGAAAATALLPLLENNYAHARVIGEDDRRLQEEYVEFPGPQGAVRAYLATPTGSGRSPAVVVIHENRGLNPHIEDVARRAATAGFLAVAPDALSPLGGTPDDSDRARTMMGQLDAGETRDNFLAAVMYAKNHPRSTGKVGCVGFCWGGAMANQLAVHSGGLDAAVAFYGRQPAAEDVAKIRASLLLHYAGLDRRINAGIEAYEAALRDARVDYELHMYEGVNHAFHNDTSLTRYDEAAATLAWERTIAFFDDKLR
jgi:carboxymethylenebutenolidase